jgi:hypothetical protein
METTTSNATQRIGNVSEKFLHHVWKFGWFSTVNLMTAAGQKIEILHRGIHNHNAGPDFMNARIRIDETLWWGNVEIHIRASDWHRHHHQTDENYKNVILHVVLDNDAPIHLNTPGDLPVLDLSKCLEWDILKSHRDWIENYRWIPCESVIHQTDSTQRFMAADRLLVERLHKRVDAIFETLNRVSGDWSQVAFVELCKAFGFKSNSLPMEMLANSISYTIIARHSSDSMQIEALLFGQAGLLHSVTSDEYEQQLHIEYEILKAKYGLNPLSKSIWNFGKVRPSNSPFIRIAQLANVLNKANHLVSSLLHLELTELSQLLCGEAHSYWQTHKKFGIVRKKKLSTAMGKLSTEHLLVNLVCRLRFAHGKYHNNESMITGTLDLLHRLPAERNLITHHWGKLGMPSEHAGDSQALIELYSVYCTHERCIECPIGVSLLPRKPHETHSQLA